MGHVEGEGDVLVEHFAKSVHHVLGGACLVLAAPLVEPSAPELRAHQRSLRTHFLEFAELVVDVGTCAEVHRPHEVVETVVEEVARPVALEECHLVESDRTEAVADFAHVGLVNSVGAVFVLHLHHDDGTAILDGEGSELLAHLGLEDLDALHEVGVALTQFDVFLLEQPPGQAAHFPFGAHVWTWTHDDVHAVLLCQAAEGSHVVVACPVEYAFLLLVDVPEDVDAHGVHAQRLAHLDAMLPVSLGNARVVNLCSLHHERLAVEQERAFACFKSPFGCLGNGGRRGQHRHHQREKA